MRYGIGVGREGFTWKGVERVEQDGGMAGLASAGGNDRASALSAAVHGRRRGNPLGARALYLGKTLYRIHGTNQPSTIG